MYYIWHVLCRWFLHSMDSAIHVIVHTKIGPSVWINHKTNGQKFIRKIFDSENFMLIFNKYLVHIIQSTWESLNVFVNYWCSLWNKRQTCSWEQKWEKFIKIERKKKCLYLCAVAASCYWFYWFFTCLYSCPIDLYGATELHLCDNGTRKLYSLCGKRKKNWQKAEIHP